MMPAGTRMDRNDFERALADASSGVLTTDQGADNRTTDALTEIATLGATPEREAEALSLIHI